MSESSLSLRYLWTWDHSTNWTLDDPGLVNFGWKNRYLKRAETFIKDYQQLIDHCQALGISGIVIWGFLRADHGGIDAAKEIVDYANQRGVGIFPGVGTASYGGFFYEGEHPYNTSTWLGLHPELRALDEDGIKGSAGEPSEHLCPAKPENVKWLKEGIRWLFDTFDIAGVNLENGDLTVSHTPEAKAARAALESDEPDHYKDQLLAYQPVLEEIRDILDTKTVTYATYTGFLPQEAEKISGGMAAMSPKPPLFATHLPEQAIAQWTLTDMLLEKPVPLTAYLDDGEPEAVYENPNWPCDLRPPTKRSAGVLQQGSVGQFVHLYESTRYDMIVSHVKEACLRAHRAGMEALSIFGDVTARHIPWALNYLAFSHFTRFPTDSLRAFARKTLAGEVGDEDRAVRFVEILAGVHDGLVNDKDRHDAGLLAKQACRDIANGQNVKQSRYWLWLDAMTEGQPERFTRSFF